MRCVRFALAAAIPLVSFLLMHGAARAGGFALNEMGAASVGNAHAGGAAAAEDLSTIYFNPAGLSRMRGRQFMGALSAIRPSAEFGNRGSSFAPGIALTGGNGGDAGSWAAVPALYYAMDLPFNPQLRFGIGVQSPFGLRTEYDDGWVGRYQALTSELKSVNINPTLSYRVNDSLSFGAGISAQYVDVELSRAIDVGTICAVRVGAACTALGLRPQASDGRVTVSGDDWGYGFNLGVLYSPTNATRFGAAYRSKISHGLSGDASFSTPAGTPAALITGAGFVNTGASANVDLPESLSFSAYADIDPRWSVMGDLTWMRWNRFRELRIRFNSGIPDSVTPEQWRNTVRVAFGANYRYTDIWKLRAGVAYDQSPVRSEFRTPRIPDNNRVWLSIGAQYKPSANGAWDFGYAHLFVKDSSIDKTETLGGRLTGNYENNVNILSVQYSHAF
ncbi:MAG: transporter [Noviherbaspirillum sp.]|nr:transporter [Noviherbaspirillum sp.]